MLSAVILLVSTLLYGAVHSLLASRRMKRRVRLTLGPDGMRYYRLGYNLVALLSLLPVLALAGRLPDRRLYTLPAPLLYLALAIQGAALLVGGITLLQTGALSFFGLQQLRHPQGEEQGPLVVRGAYRWVRHPLYLAGLLLIWLAPVMTTNLLALNLGLTAYIAAGIALEERKLLAQFGPAYRHYQQRTPMLLPLRTWTTGPEER